MPEARKRPEITVLLGLALIILAGTAHGQPVTQTPAAAQLEDIAVFRRDFLARDKSFAPSARAEAERRLHVLEGKAGKLDGLRVTVELCRIAALADNGHTHCQFESIPGAGVAMSVYPLQGEHYVVSTADADLLGARLTAIDGKPIARVRRQVRDLTGGRIPFRDLVTAGVYVRPDLLNAMGIARRPDRARYRFVAPDGRSIERELVVGSGQATVSIDGPAASWAFQDLSRAVRWADAPAHDAVVVQMRRNYNRNGEPIADRLAEAERLRAQLGRRNVILDMRENWGGDLTLTRKFLVAWPDHVGPEGRFVVLLGPQTFSAGMASTAYLKQAGGERVKLVGEAPGDRLMFFAEGRDVALPRSGLKVRPATERDDLAQGCRPYADCHAALAQPGGPTASPPENALFLVRMPVAVASLDPDIAAPTTIEDRLAGRDAVMAAGLKALSDCSSEACMTDRKTLAGF
jgi:hypothetical protein